MNGLSKLCLFFFLPFLSLRKSSLPWESFSAYSGKWCAGGVCLSRCPLYPTSSPFMSSEKKKAPLKKNPKPNQPKNPSSYRPGCAGKGCWASKSVDIYPKLLNARNQVEPYCHSPTCKPGMGIIPASCLGKWETLLH